MVSVRALPGSGGHALVCVNGDCSEEALQSATLYPYSVVIAVDGGLRHALRLNRDPDWLIGDLDSVDPEMVDVLAAGHTKVIRHPVEKDATDLELALLHAAALGVNSISLVGLTGGRLDHALANVFLLGRYDWPFSVEFFCADGYGYLITEGRSFNRELPVDATLSLLPLTDDVTGVTTSGLSYPLNKAAIGFGATLGISNVVKEPAVGVAVSSGKLLLMTDLDLPLESQPE